MKHIIIALTMVTASCESTDQADLFVGKFGHAYTNTKNDPVWHIQKNNGQYQLVTLNDEEASASTHEWSPPERKKFWQNMWWPENTSTSARCVGNVQRVLCHVPPQQRREMDDLKNHNTDYFYYDARGGIMEVHKIPQ